MAWESVALTARGNQHGPAGRELSRSPAPASDAGNEGAECLVLRGSTRLPRPAPAPSAALPQTRPHSASLCTGFSERIRSRAFLVCGLEALACFT